MIYQGCGLDKQLPITVCVPTDARRIKASLREGGGTRSVTEGACGTYDSAEFSVLALSLSRRDFGFAKSKRQLPPGGSLTKRDV